MSSAFYIFAKGGGGGGGTLSSVSDFENCYVLLQQNALEFTTLLDSAKLTASILNEQ